MALAVTKLNLIGLLTSIWREMNGNLILIQEITSGSFLLQNLAVEAGVQLMSSEFHSIRKLF